MIIKLKKGSNQIMLEKYVPKIIENYIAKKMEGKYIFGRRDGIYLNRLRKGVRIQFKIKYS